MGANQSAPEEVGEPRPAGHDMDSDQWTEEFSKEYNRLRSTDAELSAPAEPPDMLEDEPEYAERERERERPGPPRVPLQEMMVKESLSEIQSMLGPVIGREIISEGAGAENRFSCGYDTAGDHRDHRDHRGGDEYESSHGMRKRPRLGSPQHHGMSRDGMVAVPATGDSRDIPAEHAYATSYSGGHEGGASCEGRGASRAAYEWRGHGERGHGRGDGGVACGGASDDAGLSYCYGVDPVQRQNVSELNATMEAALSALYDNSGIAGSSLLGTPQFTVRPPPLSLPRDPATLQPFADPADLAYPVAPAHPSCHLHPALPHPCPFHPSAG